MRPPVCAGTLQGTQGRASANRQQATQACLARQRRACTLLFAGLPSTYAAMDDVEQGAVVSGTRMTMGLGGGADRHNITQ